MFVHLTDSVFTESYSMTASRLMLKDGVDGIFIGSLQPFTCALCTHEGRKLHTINHVLSREHALMQEFTAEADRLTTESLKSYRLIAS